jgi:arylsulfatase A-like enzyme
LIQHVQKNIAMKFFAVGALISAVFVFFADSSFGANESSDDKPNFVVVLVDDLGWNDVGCYGSKFYETPNIDAFAKSSVRFTDAYAAGSVCSPTRAALMTGLYPPRVGITDWIPGRGDRNQKLATPQINNQLPLQNRTIAERLKDAGYKTCFVGKWHLGSKGFFPEQQGFDLNFGGHSKGSPPGGYYAPYKNPKLSDGPAGEYLTDRLTDESIKFIEKNRDQPFLLYLSWYTVHTPIQPCQRHLQKFVDKKSAVGRPNRAADFVREHNGWTRTSQDNAQYASMVYAMDENFGRLIKALERLELAEETVVIFTSDNGGLSTLTRKGGPTACAPLRAGKGWLYEGGIRVPLLIKVPGVTETIENKTSSIPTISMDVTATIMDLAKLDTEKSESIDGESLVPILKNPDEILQRECLCWHYPHYHGSAWKPGAAIRAGDWKLVKFYETAKVELYNLKNDIGEQNDLAAAQAGKRQELLEQLESWQKEVGAKLPVLRKTK